MDAKITENEEYTDSKITENEEYIITSKIPMYGYRTNKYFEKNNIKHEIVNILHVSEYYNVFFRYVQFFDKCFNVERFNNHDNWSIIGSALMNIYGDDASEIFDYFACKSVNYINKEETLKIYNSFKKNILIDNKIEIIYNYAKNDNEIEYNNIMFNRGLYFNDMDIAYQIKENVGNLYISKRTNANNYTLYCFNGKYWENDDRLLKLYISSALYQFYENMIITSFLDTKKKSIYLNNIKKLKNRRTIESIIKGYERIAYSRDIIFDDKYWLFAFNNVVYNLKGHKFRQFRYKDYISITTGYDWVEPTEPQITLINKLLNEIMPIEEEKKAYLQLLSTCLEGRNLEKFIIINGPGNNAKTMINNLILRGLGNYGFIIDSAIIIDGKILFESKKSFYSEIIKLHKKRFVVFRGDYQDCEFDNAIIRELCANNIYINYGNYNDIEIHATYVVECNNIPLLKYNPTITYAHILVDILFRSTFVMNNKLVDEGNNIYKANPNFMSNNFQKNHCCALLKILMESYKEYVANNYIFDIPLPIQERTNAYLEDCCDIYQYIRNLFIIPDNGEDILFLNGI